MTRVGHQPAVAVGEPGADQALDRVQLECRPADVAAVVGELHRRARRRGRSARARRRPAARPSRRARAPSSSVSSASSKPPGGSKAKNWPRLPIVVMPPRARAAVFSSPAGVPIMKSPRCGCTGAARDLGPVAGLQARARLLGRRRAPRLGQAHRAREAEAEAVQRVPVLGQSGDDLVERALGGGPVAEAEVDVVGERGRRRGAALVRRPRRRHRAAAQNAVRPTAGDGRAALRAARPPPASSRLRPDQLERVQDVRAHRRLGGAGPSRASSARTITSCCSTDASRLGVGVQVGDPVVEVVLAALARELRSAAGCARRRGSPGGSGR